MPMVLLVQSVMVVCFYRFSSYSFTIFSFSFCFVSQFCLLLVVGSLLCCLALLFHPIARHQSGGESPGCFFFFLFSLSLLWFLPRFLTCPFVLSGLSVVLPRHVCL